VCDPLATLLKKRNSFSSRVLNRGQKRTENGPIFVVAVEEFSYRFWSFWERNMRAADSGGNGRVGGENPSTRDPMAGPWTCPRCNRVFGPMALECRPCNEVVVRGQLFPARAVAALVHVRLLDQTLLHQGIGGRSARSLLVSAVNRTPCSFISVSEVNSASFASSIVSQFRLNRFSSLSRCRTRAPQP
jgi:hypothetical protein